MSEVQCPRCGNSVFSLEPVDTEVIARVKEKDPQAEVPSEVCAACLSQMGGTMSKGSVLLAREKAKEQKKLMLWKSRVNLIKKARNSMQSKAFSDAAVAYEKYIKVLEVVFDADSGGLAPEHFKDSARTKELTVVASVYWDLLRIYDTSSKYGDRQSQSAKKLGQFLRFTPIYPDVLRKAESFARSAKNPSVIKSFIKSASEQKGRCFIATSAFEDPAHPTVMNLQLFRDHVLLRSPTGRAINRAYYWVSPPIAGILDKNPKLKPLVRWSLKKIENLAGGQFSDRP
jgi:hypothetical protein